MIGGCVFGVLFPTVEAWVVIEDFGWSNRIDDSIIICIIRAASCTVGAVWNKFLSNEGAVNDELLISVSRIGDETGFT